MKKKIYIVIILMMLITFFSGMTYSFFNSSTTFTSSNQGVAKFIFEATKLDEIDLNLSGLMPGVTNEYSFSVTNTDSNYVSDVVIEYQLCIKTYHFIPITIDLYKIENGEEKLIGKCDEKVSRDSNNELICNMPINTLSNFNGQTDDYKLKISFPIEYNDYIYSNLVDYINIEIESWQKI